MSNDIRPLATWARQFALDTAAPAGQPNLVAENMTEIAMFLDQHCDFVEVDKRVAVFKTAVIEHNAHVSAMCKTRRADVVPCSTTSTKCADCPKRRGFSLTAKVLA